MTKRMFTLAAAAAALSFTACGSDTMDDVKDDIDSAATDVGDAVDEAGEDAMESTARNVAREAGGDQFTEAGHELDGELTCESTVIDERLSKVEIRCTGTTAAGGDAVLEGATNELPGRSFDSMDGLFKGTVDGNEVFAVDELGD
jgi:predicted small secreted protein